MKYGIEALLTPEPPDDYPQFIQFAQLPENIDRDFELIDGEIFEKMPGSTRDSEFSHIIAYHVRLFCHTNNLPCYTSGASGAYRVGNDVIVPDFAFKSTAMSREYPDPVPPLFAVEVVSATTEFKYVHKKSRFTETRVSSSGC